MAPSESDNLPSKPGVVGSSPAGRADFPLREQGAEGRKKSASAAFSPDSVPANDAANKTNARAALNVRADDREHFVRVTRRRLFTFFDPRTGILFFDAEACR